MKYKLLLILTIFTGLLNAQHSDSCSYELKGRILDADTKEALPYVEVKLKGGNRQMLTNLNGEFHFTGLCDSTNTLIMSCFGYCDTTCEHFHEHGKTPHIFLKQEVVSLSTVTIKVVPLKESGTASGKDGKHRKACFYRSYESNNGELNFIDET